MPSEKETAKEKEWDWMKKSHVADLMEAVCEGEEIIMPVGNENRYVFLFEAEMKHVFSVNVCAFVCAVYAVLCIVCCT